jgi:hypothetical protein
MEDGRAVTKKKTVTLTRNDHKVIDMGAGDRMREGTTELPGKTDQFHRNNERAATPADRAHDRDQSKPSQDNPNR